MAVFDIAGLIVGTAHVQAPLAVTMGFSGTAGGAALATSGAKLKHQLRSTLVGAAQVTGRAQQVLLFGGLTAGMGSALDERLKSLAGSAAGSCTVTGALLRVRGLHGAVGGAGSVRLSIPEPVYGVAVVTGFLEWVRVPRPVSQTPQVSKQFGWGHQFGRGDLVFLVTGGSVGATYTLYQIQRGCAPKQMGPGSRKPGTSGVGCYYATGTAGECGQPGLWMIRWRYQGTFGQSPVEQDCYFCVVDSVLSPVPGDTLPRSIKYGWD